LLLIKFIIATIQQVKPVLSLTQKIDLYCALENLVSMCHLKRAAHFFYTKFHAVLKHNIPWFILFNLFF